MNLFSPFRLSYFYWHTIGTRHTIKIFNKCTLFFHNNNVLIIYFSTLFKILGSNINTWPHNITLKIYLA